MVAVTTTTDISGGPGFCKPAVAGVGSVILTFLMWHASSAIAQLSDIPPQAVVVAGDAIPAPLTSAPADPARGRTIVLDRSHGNCLICHRVPVPSEPFQGTIGPDLSGVGRRLSGAQIRLRMVDQSRLNPATMMPPFYRTQSLTRVDGRYAGKPVLTAQQIEDVVSFLATLTE